LAPDYPDLFILKILKIMVQMMAEVRLNNSVAPINSIISLSSFRLSQFISVTLVACKLSIWRGALLRMLFDGFHP
jgi:hypothetical protein